MNAQFDFFRRAISYLSCTHHVQLDVAKYLERLSDSAAGGHYNHHARMVEASSMGSLHLGVEIVWKTHMLRPLLYAQACCTAVQSSDALDLVDAIRRQQVFMCKVLAVEADAYDEATALAGYASFMRRARALRGSEASVLEPELMVDLVWHTHMQAPNRYKDDCVQMVGFVLDHNDE